jgi:hypothetical protein
MTVHRGSRIGALLIEEGVLPPGFGDNVKEIELRIPAGGAVELECALFPTTEQLAGIQRALARAVEEQKELTKP